MTKKSILAFVHEEYEDLELLYPKYRMIEAGYHFVVAGPEEGKVYKGKHGCLCRSDRTFAGVKESEFIALIIPGGYAPDKLRRDSHVLSLTHDFHEKRKLVAYICHGGWVPISAKIVNGITCTSTPAIKDDLINAGALWVDEPVVCDRNHITSRRPDDLPYFCQRILQFLNTTNNGE